MKETYEFIVMEVLTGIKVDFDCFLVTAIEDLDIGTIIGVYERAFV